MEIAGISKSVTFFRKFIAKEKTFPSNHLRKKAQELRFFISVFIVIAWEMAKSIFCAFSTCCLICRRMQNGEKWLKTPRMDERGKGRGNIMRKRFPSCYGLSHPFNLLHKNFFLCALGKKYFFQSPNWVLMDSVIAFSRFGVFDAFITTNK